MREDVAAVRGVGANVPLGRLVRFAGGARGALLWRVGAEVAYAAVLEGAAAPGEAAEVDAAAVLEVAADAAHLGRRLDFLGRGEAEQPGGPAPVDLAAPRGAPVLADPAPTEARQPIYENLHTGVKGIDALTPVGRGQSMLLVGAPGEWKSRTAADVVATQLAGTGGGGRTECVYASFAEGGEAPAAAPAAGEGAGSCTVVADASGLPARRYLAACTACALGEAVRDAGGHAVVVLDRFNAVLPLWDCILAMETEAGTLAGAQLRGAEEMVEVNGMLVSAVAAARRKFLSALVQRAAKLAEELGGGSLSLFPVVNGRTARPAAAAVTPAAVEQMATLSPELKAKLLQALEARQAGDDGGAGEAGGGGADANVAVVEELMSISDGHAVLSHRAADRVVALDPASSITRVGAGRTSHPAVYQLAGTLRLDLTQDRDAREFGADDAITRRQRAEADRLGAFLEHRQGRPVPLGRLIAALHVLKRPELGGGPDALDAALDRLERADPALLAEVAAGGALSDALARRIEEACA